MNNGTTISDLTSLVVRQLNGSPLSVSKELGDSLAHPETPSISVLKPAFHFVKADCRRCDGTGRVCAGSWTDQANCICDECGGRGSIQYKLRTEYVFPPIPDRSMDWAAYDDERYDADYDYESQRYFSKSIVGRGETEQAAIGDFLEQVRTSEI